MPRFFLEHIPEGTFSVTGENARHIACSLRMKPGEELTLCDGHSADYRCRIETVSPEAVRVCILEKRPCAAEPNVQVSVYVCLPKGDKLEFVIQKSVELGAGRIIPVLSSRCVSRPKKEQYTKKQERWQKIALEAAKQSGRGIVPEVSPILDFSAAVKELSGNELPVLFYECGGEPLSSLIGGAEKTAGFLIGPEGGLAPNEVEEAEALGIKTATLGPRILRAETAPVAALSILMYAFGEM